MQKVPDSEETFRSLGKPIYSEVPIMTRQTNVILILKDGNKEINLGIQIE